jgi:hypothetical protein
MQTRTKVLLAAIGVAALARLLPHPWNFTPMGALALFGAATLTDKRLALLVPVAAMVITDLGIEVLHRLGLTDPWGIYRANWTTYLAFLLVTLIGFSLRGRRRLLPIGAATLAASVVFFLVTNFAVWAFQEVTYPQTPAGLYWCYVAGIPYFWRTLLGDVVFSTALFGGLALAEERFAVLREPAPASGHASA